MLLPMGRVGVATTTCVPRLMFAVVGAFVVVHERERDAPGRRDVGVPERVQVGAVEGAAVAVTITDLPYVAHAGNLLVCRYGRKVVAPAALGVKV